MCLFNNLACPSVVWHESIDAKDLRPTRSVHDRGSRTRSESRRSGGNPCRRYRGPDRTIIGMGYNRVETDKDPTAHGEIVALREAARNSGDWRLPGSTVYVTLEPCIMCAAALIHARVKRLVFGARDERWGGVGSSV